jgi:hypothetical protein
VPAFETDGNLLALLPREALTRVGRASKKGARRPTRTDIKIVVVGENRDFSVLAAEIKGAWLLHEASGTQPSQTAHGSSLDPSIAFLVASAMVPFPNSKQVAQLSPR